MSILTTVAISSFTAWVTMRLALHRYYREKWWDKRATAYLDLIDALYDFKKDYETIADNEHTKSNYQRDDEVIDEPLSKEDEAELWERLSVTHKKLEKIKGLGPLIFTDDALLKVSNFIENDKKVSRLAMSDAIDNFDAYNEISISADELYKEFKTIALKELNVTTWYGNLRNKIMAFLIKPNKKFRERLRK